MSTHNLAHTIIERGRTSRWSKMGNNRKVVPKFRLHHDSEYWGNEINQISIGKLYQRGWDWEFHDKIVVIEKYLLSNLNRPWNDVYSELCQRYDRRNLRNWHMMQHLKNLITRYGDQYMYTGSYHKQKDPIDYKEYCKDRLHIDEDGILRIGEEYTDGLLNKYKTKNRIKYEYANILYYISKKESENLIKYFVYHNNEWYIGIMKYEIEFKLRKVTYTYHRFRDILAKYRNDKYFNDNPKYNRPPYVYWEKVIRDINSKYTKLNRYIEITPSSKLNMKEQQEHNLYHGQRKKYIDFDKEFTWDDHLRLEEMKVRIKK